MPVFEIFTNILIPALAGLLLLLYFLYFAFIEDTDPLARRFFSIFLISFSLFLFGRPLQILAGPHPIPLVINNIHSLLFCGLTIPIMMSADFTRQKKHSPSGVLKLIIPGTLLGILYCIFNTLTTTGSEVIFTSGTFAVYDSVTPNMAAPYFGREVTNAVYITAAAALFIDSLGKILRTKGIRQMSFIFNTGKLIFAVTFVAGALVHQWWIYYIGSLVSVVLLGSGAALDIQDKRRKMGKIISYIKEDLIQDLSVDSHIHQQAAQMLNLLHIPSDINTFIVLKESPSSISFTGDRSESRKNNLIKEISVVLDRIRGENQFILMPMGTDMLGICLSIPRSPDFGRCETIRICEYLRQTLDVLKNYDFGIGRSYSGLEDIKESFHEAVNVVEYAKSIRSGQVIHITDLQDDTIRVEYPLKERSAFLSAVRIGDGQKAQELLETLLDLLFRYSVKAEKLLKIRIYELLGAMIESAIAGGGDADVLLEVSEKLFSESDLIRSRIHIVKWLKSRTEEIINIVSRSHTNRSQNIVHKAKEYIDEHFAEAISVKDVADAVCIS